jgi:TP901 family phage tail tape measure protein
MADIAELDLVINTKDTTKATAALGKFEKSAKGAAAGADALATKTVGLGGAMSFALKQAGALAIASAGLFAAGAGVKAIADFDQAMATLSGTIVHTAADMAELRAQAKQLGSSTRFSAGQAAEAQLELARAGLSVNGVLATAPKVLNLATAANLELGASALIVTTAMAQFSLKTDQAGRITDVFVKAANSAATTVPEVAAAMANVGVISAQTGKSLEQTTAAIALLQDNGIKGAAAGTALRSSMAGLLNPSKEAAGILDQLAKRVGASASDFDIAKHSFTEVFGLLGKAGASTGDLTKIFGTEGFSAAAILAGAPERLQLIEDALNGSEGAAEELAKIMADTLPGAFDSLKSAIEAAFIEAGDAGLLGVFKDILQVSAEVIRNLAGLTSGTDSLSTTANALANAIRAVSVGLATFAALASAQKAIAFAKGIGGVTKAFKLFSAAVAANPLLAVATVVSLLVFALIELSEEFVTVGGESVRIGNLIKATWDVVVAGLTQVWNDFTEAFAGPLAEMKEAFEEAWNSTVKFFKDIWESVVSAFSGGTNDMDSKWKTILRDMLTVWKSVSNKIIGIYVSIFTTAVKIFERLGATWASVFEIDTSDLRGSAERIKAAVLANYDLSSIFDDTRKTFSDNFQRDFIGDGIELGAKLGSAISTSFGKALKSDLITEIKSRAIELQKAEDLLNAKRKGESVGKQGAKSTGGESTAKAAEDAAKAAAKAADALRNVVEGLRLQRDLAGVSDEEKERVAVLNKVVELTKEALGVKGDLISQEQADRIIAVKDAASALFKEVKDAEAFADLETKGNAALDSIVSSVETARESIKDAFSSGLAREILDVRREFAEQLKDENKLLDEQVRLGQITIDQALERSESADLALEQLAKARVASGAFENILNLIADFNDDLQGSIDNAINSLTKPEFFSRIDAIAQSLSVPLEQAAEEINKLAEAGAITSEAYVASMKVIEEATQQAAVFANDVVILEKVRELAQGVSSAIGSSLKSLVLGTATAQEAALALVNTLTDLLLTKVIIEPFVELLSAGITKAFASASSLASDASGAATVAAGGVQAAAALTTGAATSAATLSASGAAVSASMIAGATAAAQIMTAAAAASSLSSVGGLAANGAVYSRGVMAFAAGGVLANASPMTAGASSANGILNGPHSFPLRNGSMGVAGEAGPEAIMPLVRANGRLAVESNMGPLTLKRGANGRLGVQAFADGGIFPGRDAEADVVQPTSGGRSFVGGSPSGAKSIQNVTLNVRSTSPNDFKKSTNQIARDIKRVTRGK